MRKILIACCLFATPSAANAADIICRNYELSDEEALACYDAFIYAATHGEDTKRFFDDRPSPPADNRSLAEIRGEINSRSYQMDYHRAIGRIDGALYDMNTSCAEYGTCE